MKVETNVIQMLLRASESEDVFDVFFKDGNVISGRIEFVKKNIIINDETYSIDLISDVKEHKDNPIFSKMQSLISERVFIKKKDCNEVFSGFLVDCDENTVELITSDQSLSIALCDVEIVSDEPIDIQVDAKERYPFGGFEAKLYAADYIESEAKNECLNKFEKFDYLGALDILSKVNVRDEYKADLYEMVEYLQNTVARYEEKETTLNEEYGYCYYGGLAGIVEQNIRKSIDYYMKEIEPWGKYAALALYCSLNTTIKLADNEMKHEVANMMMKYIPNMENTFGTYSQNQAYRLLLSIYSIVEDWDKYSECLDILVDVLVKDGHIVSANNAIIKYTKRLAENKQFDMAKDKAKRLFTVGENRKALMLLMYIEYLRDNSVDLPEQMLPYLTSDEINGEWGEIQRNHLHSFLESASKAEYIDEYCSVASGGLANKESINDEETAIGDESEADRLLDEWESTFTNYRMNGQIAPAKKYFKKKAIILHNDRLEAILSRIDLWQAQYGSFRSIGTPSSNYERGMYKWFEDKENNEASLLFMKSIESLDVDRNTALLAFLDFMAIEYGYDQALGDNLTKLRSYVRDMDKKMKITFYEKIYAFAFISKNSIEALSALNSLQNLYYSKTQLGKTEYRIAGIYYSQKKWSKAKEYLQKASQYEYGVAITIKMLDNCEKGARGEQVGPFIFDVESVKNTDIENEKKVLERFYDEMKYDEARSYIRKLCENNSDNEELLNLKEKVEKVVENLNMVSTTLTRKTDNAGKAWRAWHIEENYEKAERYYRDEISKNGTKKSSCLFDLSEMLMHTKGNAAGIACLREKEMVVRTWDIQKQASYYEKMYIMLQKTEENDEKQECLDKLLQIYKNSKLNEKIAFTYYRKGVVSFTSKQYEEAIHFFNTAIAGKYKGATVCYQYIVNSYVQGGESNKAIEYAKSILELESTIQDNNLTQFLNKTIERLQECGDELINLSGDEESESEVFEVLTEYNDRLVWFLLSNPLIAQQVNAEGDTLRSKIFRYQREQFPKTKTSEIHKYTLYENQINGPTQLFYKLVQKCANGYAEDAFQKRNFDSYFLWNMYLLSNIQTNEPTNIGMTELPTQRLLKCALKNSSISGDVSVEELVFDIMNSDSAEAEYSFRMLLFVINKSHYLNDTKKGHLAEYLDKSENAIWTEQLLKFLNIIDYSKSDDSNERKNVQELIDCVHKRVTEDTDYTQKLINKFKSSRSFDEEYVDELRKLKDTIFAFEYDVTLISEFVTSYEKAMETYEYPDYDNRLATVRTVQDKLINISNMIEDRPTYFGIYYLSDLIDATLNLLNIVSDTTKKELAPELYITVPITEIETVDNQQTISITVSNKENCAIATSLFVSVIDAEKKELLEKGSIELAPFLKGGSSKSIELDIKVPDSSTFSIRIQIQYKNHMDEICHCVQDETISTVSASYEEIIGNPYVDGKALDPKKNSNVFMGRDILLNELSSSLVDDSSQCVIIYGQKRCGKTSISNFLQEKIKDHFFVISFSAGAAISASQLYNNVRTKFIFELRKMVYGKDIVISDTERDFLSQYIETLSNLVVTDGESFIEMMRVIYGGYCIRYDKELLIIIDEFTHLYRLYQKGEGNRDEVTAFMDTWKKGSEEKLFKSLLIGQDTMPYIMAAYPNQLAITDPRRVDRLSDESVKELIEKPILLDNGSSRYLEKSIDLIANWFYGQPYYISVYCKKMVEHMKALHKNYVTNAMAEKVKNDMLSSSTISFFDNLINAGDIDSSTDNELKSLPTYKLLCNIAFLTKNSEWANIDDIDMPGREQLIEDLINRSVIERRRGKCRILINFFKEWLNIYGRE